MRAFLVVGFVFIASVTLGAADEQTLVVTGGPKPCNSQPYANTWGPNEWGTLYVTGGYVWQGVARGLRGDIGAQLYRTTPTGGGTLIHVVMNDRYADPNCADCTISPLRFGVDGYVVLHHGDSLRLDHSCALVGAQPPPTMAAATEYGTWPFFPFDYYYNIGGHDAHAYLKVTAEKPGAALDAILHKLTELTTLMRRGRE